MRVFNRFLKHFKENLVEQKEGEEVVTSQVVTNQIHSFYGNPQIESLINNLSETLKIVQYANIEVNESLTNLILVVFSSFYPEISAQVEKESKKKEEEKKKSPEERKGAVNKFNVVMNPISMSPAKESKEKFKIFRSTEEMSARVQKLSDFSYRNSKIINSIVRQKNNFIIVEMEEAIKHMSNLLDFENKRAYFKVELQKMKRRGNQYQFHEELQLSVRRNDIFMDTYAQLSNSTPEQLKNRLRIQFMGEAGQDAGGLTREFYTELSREMFNPNYSLFLLSSSGSTYYPNHKSGIEKEHLRYFKFIGRILGKALLDEQYLDCYFVKTLYKMLLGEPLDFQDLEDYDYEFYTNLNWCKNNDITSLGETFCVS
mmetsp:Transcript_9556/g.9165  ORF Transcript_9556/g.9165 Transcript_9556/m.9165 type:complete len:371 (-) Transcript_9556:625-1737(-)